MASLVKKLGIRPGQAICLLNATSKALALLRQEYSKKVRFSDALGNEQYDIIIFWPTQLAELSGRFAELQRHIVLQTGQDQLRRPATSLIDAALCYNSNNYVRSDAMTYQ